MDNEKTKSDRFFNLYNSVHLRLYSYLLTILHNSNDAEEVLQETASLLWGKFDEYQEGSNFGAWAVKIGRNKALQFLKKHKQTRRIFDDNFYDKVSQYAEKSSNEADARLKALKACVDKLPEHVKKLLSMKFTKEMSYRKISQQTGRTTNSLYQVFWKIMQTLKDCIERQLSYQEK